MEENLKVNHNLILEDRKKFTLTGVKDVLTFDEETVVLDTYMGRLNVKGEELHINSFDKDGGDLIGEGRVHALIYSAEETKGGFFSRLLR